MRVAEIETGRGLQQVQRFVDEELMQPEQEADEERLVEPQRGAHVGPDLRRNGQRQIAQGIVRRERQQREDYETDDQQDGNRE